MIGKILNKENLNDIEYAKTAEWCNNNNATIEDKGDYFEVVEIIIPPLTVEEQQKLYTDFVQRWMDGIVQERGYDSVHTCVGTYLNSPVERFRLEAEAVKDWVSYVWQECYIILDAVLSGERALPTYDELISELPKLEWGTEEI